MRAAEKKLSIILIKQLTVMIKVKTPFTDHFLSMSCSCIELCDSSNIVLIETLHLTIFRDQVPKVTRHEDDSPITIWIGALASMKLHALWNLGWAEPRMA
jgi:hypothetical protein